MKKIVILMMLSFLSFSHSLMANEISLQVIQNSWAVSNYDLKEKQQDDAFKSLLHLSEQAVNQYPESAEFWIWDGIVKSSYAGVKGGLGALSYVKASRKSLEKAMQIDAAALQGSAYTSLGVLYYKSPGWPLSFGDKKEAKKLLLRALEINPEGIDPNYFYGDFLLEQGDYKQAKIYLMRAKNAAPRPDRPLADHGRQQEITEKLMELSKKDSSIYAQ